MMKKLLQRRLHGVVAGAIGTSRAMNQSLLLNGAIAARQIRQVDRVERLADIEFGVFSQWGEDGILDWIVHHCGNLPRTFIEFGVENYTESNTRFLLQHRHWRGLVIDGSDEHVAFIRDDEISWKHDLTAVARFITAENIDEIITGAGFGGEIGVLSVDIDGNDYWVWEAISSVRPHIVVAEYNSAFGDVHPLTIPYAPDFFRTNADPSNLYYGASIRALEHLATTRGYTLIGCNGAGTNAFFVRTDHGSSFAARIADMTAYPTRARESRGEAGEMTLVPGDHRADVIGKKPVQNVVTGTISTLLDVAGLSSARWQQYYQGMV